MALINASGSAAVMVTAVADLTVPAISASGSAQVGVTAYADLTMVVRAAGNSSAMVFPAALQGISLRSMTGKAWLAGNAVQLNAGDIAAAVWNQIVEADYSAAEVLRLVASVTQGAVSNVNGVRSFKGLDDTTTRIVGSASNGSRVIAERDPR